jgi:dethiobiotin synthetase
MTDRKTYFITGTDTDAGKTYVSVLLANYWRRLGERVAVHKPVAAGATKLDDEWVNDDALALKSAATPGQNYASINPYVLPDACAPHIAAENVGVALSVDALVTAFNANDWSGYQRVIVEGAGGWLVPLNETETLADYVEAIEAQVILVVGMRLGCLNHALLTYQAIAAQGLPVKGWIANVVDPEMPYLAQNITTLNSKLPIPMLAHVDYQQQQISLSLT